MKRLLFILVYVTCTFSLFAKEFSYNHEGQTLTYSVISEKGKTVGTVEGTTDAPGNDIKGDLVIPLTVQDEKGKIYTVISIESDSFTC